MRNRIAARLRLPAIKIYFPNGRGIESFDQTFHRQRDLRNPGFLASLKLTRPPHATLQIAFLPWRDVQIDPKAIRADFEFLISTKLRWIWLKENFRDVAIPSWSRRPLASASEKS